MVWLCLSFTVQNNVCSEFVFKRETFSVLTLNICNVHVNIHWEWTFGFLIFEWGCCCGKPISDRKCPSQTGYAIDWPFLSKVDANLLAGWQVRMLTSMKIYICRNIYLLAPEIDFAINCIYPLTEKFHTHRCSILQSSWRREETKNNNLQTPLGVEQQSNPPTFCLWLLCSKHWDNTSKSSAKRHYTECQITHCYKIPYICR